MSVPVVRYRDIGLTLNFVNSNSWEDTVAFLLVFLIITLSFPWHTILSLQLALGRDLIHWGRQNSVFACFKAEMKSTLASPTRKERKENKSHKSSGGQDAGLKTLDPF